MKERDGRLRAEHARAQALLRANRFAEALPAYQAICEADPDDADAWLALGATYGKLADTARAEEALRRADRLRPRHAPTLFNLGIALRAAGRFEDAALELRRVTELAPAHVSAHFLLAQCFHDLARFEDAVATYRTLLELAPGNPVAHAGLALCFHMQGRLAEAESCYRRALEVGGQDANTRDYLAATLCQQGRPAETVAYHRQTLAQQPARANTLSSLLFASHYLPDQSPRQLFEDHKRWGELHGRMPADRHASFSNRPEPERPLRVGYVSADFCQHSVSFFFEPLLVNHDRSSFEITCYSATTRTDAITERLRAAAGWHEIVGLDDPQVIDAVRADGIDILVDLAGHTGENRLGVFARRAAPIQVTYLGYPDTTGVPAMDYRFCDATTDPDGVEALSTEQLVRLPGCFLCYRPPAKAPAVADPPAAGLGHVTFGSFNNLAKMNEEVMSAWAELLQAVPGARLVLKSTFLSDPESGERCLRRFADNGIDRDRITLFRRVQSTRDHLEMYRHVDVALDTFPYNGTTTTCEALWMGVPVITLGGEIHASRVGSSILTAVGLEEMATDSREQYLATAARLAGEPERLSALRSTLRERVETSILCDGARFTGLVEDAYRTMWQSWCKQGKR
jgi:predicted O-linked N-acetylglucosamine transferase (SPINDLY family)